MDAKQPTINQNCEMDPLEIVLHHGKVASLDILIGPDILNMDNKTVQCKLQRQHCNYLKATFMSLK